MAEENKLRVTENFHIVLWLIKDTCWLLTFTLAGTLMIAPTLVLAYYLAWRTRLRPLLFWPNMAVASWITANSIWMLGEFFDFNHKPYSLVLFVLGIVFMVAYAFAYFQPRK
ncbi:MAG: hypothetical protein MUE96_11665 [Bacteroidia bacterium]|jgi:hypothetical protein|nr:hypothetical protein [Bacteroidia bacterium]